ncbi:hypothetical protein JL722_8228 [Aureococcus anophagefferens]|nr:hypothetical protein JL722_8228 [Aureococcus anophagefferens]
MPVDVDAFPGEPSCRLSSFGFSGTIAHGAYVRAAGPRLLSAPSSSAFRGAVVRRSATIGRLAPPATARFPPVCECRALVVGSITRTPIAKPLFIPLALWALSARPPPRGGAIRARAAARRVRRRPRMLFFHGMDTYGEFQATTLAHQGWAALEWVTVSAPHRGSDFSRGAGGPALRERFGYAAARSRSWRLLARYSLASASQADMFARVRAAADDGGSAAGDAAATRRRARRCGADQAPLDGVAGISEGAALGFLVVALGNVPGAKRLLGVAPLAAAGDAARYDEPLPAGAAALMLVGVADAPDVHHMAGRAAAAFPRGGVATFEGGHKLPRATPRLPAAADALFSGEAPAAGSRRGAPTRDHFYCSSNHAEASLTAMRSFSGPRCPDVAAVVAGPRLPRPRSPPTRSAAWIDARLLTVDGACAPYVAATAVLSRRAAPTWRAGREIVSRRGPSFGDWRVSTAPHRGDALAADGADALALARRFAAVVARLSATAVAATLASARRAPGPTVPSGGSPRRRREGRVVAASVSGFFVEGMVAARPAAVRAAAARRTSSSRASGASAFDRRVRGLVVAVAPARRAAGVDVWVATRARSGRRRARPPLVL